MNSSPKNRSIMEDNKEVLSESKNVCTDKNNTSKNSTIDTDKSSDTICVKGTIRVSF